jgi:hypothetical protein
MADEVGRPQALRYNDDGGGVTAPSAAAAYERLPGAAATPAALPRAGGRRQRPCVTSAATGTPYVWNSWPQTPRSVGRRGPTGLVGDGRDGEDLGGACAHHHPPLTTARLRRLAGRRRHSPPSSAATGVATGCAARPHRDRRRRPRRSHCSRASRRQPWARRAQPRPVRLGIGWSTNSLIQAQSLERRVAREASDRAPERPVVLGHVVRLQPAQMLHRE